ncbi:hypothetical protein CCACVL1_31019 [Corchorus capsularis]|uniref:Uncharacterized protein n=1 Tax=Corchorus capsularis TaxID=210143 RepID=A0A1R3FU56_COCAP|nr:hypothetical protein CCACVL1_31019 [Corchorus capsularis]
MLGIWKAALVINSAVPSSGISLFSPPGSVKAAVNVNVAISVAITDIVCAIALRLESLSISSENSAFSETSAGLIALLFQEFFKAFKKMLLNHCIEVNGRRWDSWERIRKNQTVDDHLSIDLQIVGNGAKGSQKHFNQLADFLLSLPCCVVNTAKVLKQRKTETLAEDGMEKKLGETPQKNQKLFLSPSEGLQ